MRGITRPRRRGGFQARSPRSVIAAGSTGFFDGAAAGGHVAELLLWVAAGLVLLTARAATAGGPHKAGLPVAFAMRSNV